MVSYPCTRWRKASKPIIGQWHTRWPIGMYRWQRAEESCSRLPHLPMRPRCNILSLTTLAPSPLKYWMRGSFVLDERLICTGWVAWKHWMTKSRNTNHPPRPHRAGNGQEGCLAWRDVEIHDYQASKPYRGGLIYAGQHYINNTTTITSGGAGLSYNPCIAYKKQQEIKQW